MARYIDKDLLLEEIKKLNWNDDVMYHIVKVLIEDTPTADVAEVKHGKWQRQKNGFYFVCSVCGKAAATKGNYCHSCGAKMDNEGGAK